ncbi:unnamed protein product [Ixodes pacificus]
MNRACLAPLSTVVLEAAVRRAPQSTSGTRVTGPISLRPSQPAKNVGGKKIESLEHGGCLAAHSAAAAAVVRQQGLVPVLRTAAGGEGGPDPPRTSSGSSGTARFFGETGSLRRGKL